MAAQKVVTYDYLKAAPDGRVFVVPPKTKDTVYLKVGAEFVRGVPAEKPARPWPVALTVKVDYNSIGGYFNAQGLPAETGTSFRYSIDGGQTWKAVAWEWKLSPGTYTVRCEFTKPGYVVGVAEKTFTLPAKPGGSVTPNLPPTPGKTDPPVKPKPDENRQDGGEGMMLGGVEHRNYNGQIDRGAYVLQYRDMPSSTRFRYTPRVVLKEYTTGHDLQVDKFDPFNLPENDLTMYFSKAGPTDYEKLLQRGWSHINSRDVFGAGRGNKNDPNRPGKDIPWTRRAHMTQPNNFDWIPDFQSGRDLSPQQLESLYGWVLGDGVSDYFTDQQAPWMHLLDWEFAYNDRTWTALVDHYRREYGSSRALQSWMGHGQIGYNRQDRYDYWSLVSYYHLVDWDFSRGKIANASDDDVRKWKALWHADAHNLLQSIAKSEWYAAEHPGSKMLHGYMPNYEDRGGDDLREDRFPWYKLPPHLAETSPVWWLLTSRTNPDHKGGIVIWNSPLPKEPLTSEQQAICGLNRLSFHNPVRSGRYQWVVPEISHDGGSTYQPQATIQGNRTFSALNFRMERGGMVVREPVIRCLVTPTHVAIYAQNPYPDAPAVQTVKIRIPGVIEDFVTMHNVRRTYAGEPYTDRELTMAVATR